MSHTNLVMSSVSSFSSWSCSASTNASVKKTEKYTVAMEMLWAARRRGVGGMRERRAVHIRHVCAWHAERPRATGQPLRVDPEEGSGHMHAASAKRAYAC